MRHLLLALRDHAPSRWQWLLGTPTQVVVVVLLAVVVRWVVHRSVERATAAMERRLDENTDGAFGRGWRAAAGLDDERRRQRAATTGSLLKSVTTVTVVVVAVLTIAAQCGIQLAPIMASAGVAGVALGIGAQSLVKDFLSGIFMIFEDQYGVGDVIDTGEAVGTVEEVSLRITRLRDANGLVWYVRNGEIVRVANKSQGWSTSIVDVPVAYDANITLVTSTLEQAVAEFTADPEWQAKLTDSPTVAGIEAASGGALTFRIIATTVPNANFAVSREIRRRALLALEQAGVKVAPAVPGFGVNTLQPPPTK